MDFKQICFYAIMTLLFCSSGYLVFLVIQEELSTGVKVRLAAFALQHLFSLGMLVQRKYRMTSEDPRDHIKWIIAFTGINFLIFAIVEIYCLVHLKDPTNGMSAANAFSVSMIVLSYYHLYYQFNIYVGIFTVFALIMWGIYIINDRHHQERVDEVLEGLSSRKGRAEGTEDACPICLGAIEKNE